MTSESGFPTEVECGILDKIVHRNEETVDI
jgi:hypothetical protein